MEQYKCSYTPENEGTFVELWSAGATVSTGGEFIVISSTPIDDSSGDETTISGSFVDEANDILLVVVEGDAVSDGSTMTMTLGMYADPTRVVGDPIDLTATVTCAL